MTDALILYVDDERANRVVFEQSFRSRFNVRCVASGDEALTVLREGKVAVLLTDECMPGMTGRQLLEQVRAAYPLVVRIVVTAFGDADALRHTCAGDLVERYVVKPWDRAELGTVLAWGMRLQALAAADPTSRFRNR